MTKLNLALLDQNLIQKFNISEQTNYEIKRVNARQLLTAQRIDLMAKWIYIDCFVKNIDIDFGLEIYNKHLQAFSLNSFTEPGNENKVSFNDYVNVFNKMINDIKFNGFDSTKSLIPVGKNNVILDGAHRTACAAYFDEEVEVVYFPDFEVNFDTNFFLQRHLSRELIDYMIIKYSELKKNDLYCACMWPIASNQDKLKKAKKILEKKTTIVYLKDVYLNRNGLRNFLLQIYGKQEWVGNIDNNFSGLFGKLNEIQKPYSPIKVYIFEKESLNEVLRIKDEIREIFRIGKHSIHISDNSGETHEMCELLFNQNSIHHLNYSHPDKNIETYKKLKKINYCSNRYDFRTSLALYGVDSVLGNFNVIGEVVNPRNYYYFMGFKFSSLPDIINNINDKSLKQEAVYLLKLDEHFLSERKRRLNYIKTTVKWKIQNSILAVKIFLAKILSKIGLYKK